MDMKKFAQEEFAKIKGFIKNNNFNLVDISKDLCTMEALITESSMNPYNIVHGGFIFGLADTAAGILVKMNNIKGVTSSANIVYLRPVSNDKIVAQAKLLKTGSKISIVEVEVFSLDKMIAKVIFEYCGI